MRTKARARWMKMLLRFMVVPLLMVELCTLFLVLCSSNYKAQSSKYKDLNAIIFALEFESSNLILIRAIFVGLSLGFKADAPAARDHLPAHLAVLCRAE